MPRKRRRNGKGIKDVLNKIHNFVKSNKLISRGASALAPIAGPYANVVRNVGVAAGALGYGRRKRGRPRKR